ncbi:hypothetical protein WT31_10605 [Burkholderia territorii]|nr:hypothetical protein WT31_10605 [Burkholderia territorii]
MIGASVSHPYDAVAPGRCCQSETPRHPGGATALARLATRRVVFLDVGQAIQAALNQLRRVLEVALQRILRHVQHFDARVLSEVRARDEHLQAAPTPFDRLEVRRMHDCVQLTADLTVELADVKIQQRLVQAINRLAFLRDQIEQRIHAARDALVGRRFRKRVVIAKRFERPRLGDRLQVDLVAQRSVDAVVFEHDGFRCALTRFVLLHGSLSPDSYGCMVARGG